MSESHFGRPLKYKKEFCKQLIDHMENGLSYESFAGVIGVAYKTLFAWEKDHSEFAEAKGIAKAKQLLWDERMLNKGIEGKQRGYNANAHKWKMTNAHKWTDRIETNLGEDTQEIMKLAYALPPKSEE